MDGHGPHRPLTATPPTMALDGFLASVEVRGFRMAELALGHREDALDAMQDAMIAFLAYRERPQAEWPALFFSVLRSRITDRHRRNTVRQRVLSVFGGASDDAKAEDPILQVADPGAGPDAADERQRTWVALGAALRGLPRRQREAFLLRELEGLSVAEAAVAMGCSEGSVKTHLFRAQAALRTRLDDWR
ncbi:MAG: RNA polymerase sigma factor [Xanthomonadaceae bacterium]|nr:RNA polymerase sigma factor [Xanthomonadaceae bacterium]